MASLDAGRGPWSAPGVRARLLSASVAMALALAVASACATAPRGPRKCPGSATACATQMDCVMDAARDCLACTCRAWDDPRPPGGGTSHPESARPPPPAQP